MTGLVDAPGWALFVQKQRVFFLLYRLLTNAVVVRSFLVAAVNAMNLNRTRVRRCLLRVQRFDLPLSPLLRLWLFFYALFARCVVWLREHGGEIVEIFGELYGA